MENGEAPKTIEEKKLTGKQKKFADLYIGECNLNATRSAIAAGYSEKTAYSIGHENLRKPEIRAYIDNRLNTFVTSPSEVLTILSLHSKGSIADVLNENGEFDLEAAKRKGTDRLLKKLKVTKKVNVLKETETTYEYQIHDPQSAAVHLGRVHKLFADRVEHTGKDGGAIEITSAIDLSKLTDEELLQYEALLSKTHAA